MLGILFVASLPIIAQQGGPDVSIWLTVKGQKGWIAQVPSSPSRLAQFALPHVDGDSEDASVVVYFFGGGGGSIQANLDRWTNQMKQPDGSPSKDKAKV